MALVYDDVVKVHELVNVVDRTADGGEGDPAYLLPVEGGRVDGCVQNPVAAHLPVVLLQYLLGGLEDECVAIEAVRYVGNDKRLSASRGKHLDGVHPCLRAEELDCPVGCLLLIIPKFEHCKLFL